MIEDGTIVLYRNGRNNKKEAAWGVATVLCLNEYASGWGDELEYRLIDEAGEEIIRYARAVKPFVVVDHIEELIEL